MTSCPRNRILEGGCRSEHRPRLVTGEVVFTVPQLQLNARKTGTTAAARSGRSGLSILNWMPYSYLAIRSCGGRLQAALIR